MRDAELFKKLFLGRGRRRKTGGRVNEQGKTPEERRKEGGLGVEKGSEQTEERSIKPVLHVPRHIAETWETVPNLPDDNLPDLSLLGSTPFFGGNLKGEQALRQRTEVGREEGEGRVGVVRTDKGEQMGAAGLRRGSRAVDR